MAAAAVAGIQSNGVIANAKHYMVCDQDTMRSDVSQNVDERTRMEIYAPAFHGAVEAGVASVMCSCECLPACSADLSKMCCRMQTIS